LIKRPRNYRPISFSVWLAFVLLGACVSARAANPPQHAAQNVALQTTIHADGAYELDFFGVDWHLADRLPEAPESVQSTPGKDAIGSYDAVSASYWGGARTAEMRI